MSGQVDDGTCRSRPWRDGRAHRGQPDPPGCQSPCREGPPAPLLVPATGETGAVRGPRQRGHQQRSGLPPLPLPRASGSSGRAGGTDRLHPRSRPYRADQSLRPFQRQTTPPAGKYPQLHAARSIKERSRLEQPRGANPVRLPARPPPLRRSSPRRQPDHRHTVRHIAETRVMAPALLLRRPPLRGCTDVRSSRPSRPDAHGAGPNAAHEGQQGPPG